MGRPGRVPLHPGEGVTMDECVLCAQAFGQQLQAEAGCAR